MKIRVVPTFLKYILVCVALLMSFVSYAQSSFSVSLKLADENTGEPVGFATASLTVKGETTAAKFVLTDENGAATMTKIKKGTYILKAEIMGYKSYEQEIVVDKNYDAGVIKMAEDVEVLDAASVSAVGNPIVVKKDTVEYTASSFKTSDNDMLEELLKKLPGVEVEADGTITANGETIKKITIDGKTFFLDDPQLATKNIPAKIIEKVKVVEKKSDQAMFTGIDDGNEETVIDLSIRPGMMQGWFGNMMAGGGHDVPAKGYYDDENTFMNDGWRYQGAAMVGRFTEDSQISFLVNANNTNNRGFNDVAGSMMQDMRMGGMGRWGNRNGITTSWMGGMNGAFNLFDDDMELSGNYLYNGSSNHVEEESTKITYKDDGSSLIYDNKGYGNRNTQGHRFGVRLEHKFSENTSIIFEPQFNFGQGQYDEFSDFTTLTQVGEQTDTTNHGYNSDRGWNKSWRTNGFFLFRQRLGKPGRTISANLRYNFSSNEMSGYNQSLTSVLEESAWTDEIINQRSDSETNNSSLSTRIVYTEPLGHDFYLEANYEYSWNKSTRNKLTYDSGSAEMADGLLIFDPNGETLNPTYSNNIINRYINQSAGLNVQYQKDKIRAHLGASLRPTDTHNETDGQVYESNVLNWSPQAQLSYEFTENSHIRMFYFGRSSQPSTSQLIPVPDNSDPLNVSFGNPYLLPYFSHNLRGMFGYTNKQTFTSVHGHFGGGMVQDGITRAMWYDDNGAQYSLPLNGPNSGNVNLRVMVNSPLGKSKNFSIFSMTYTSYNLSTSYIGRSEKGNEFTNRYYDPETAVMQYDLFNEDFFGDNATYSLEDYFLASRTQSLNFTQRLRFTYRNDFVELRLGGRMRVSKSWYTVSNELSATWNNQVDASMNWTIPGGINLIADVDYNWYNGYTTEQEPELIMNAELTKLLFKDKFTLAVKAYDIFNQSKNLFVSDSSNYHMETRNNTLGRYIILSLTYRFGDFNKGGHGGHRGPGGPRR